MKRRLGAYFFPLGCLGLGCSAEPSAEVPSFTPTEASSGAGATDMVDMGAVEEVPTDPAAPPGPAAEPTDLRTGVEAGLEASPSLFDVLKVSDPMSVPDGVAALSRARRLTKAEYDRAVVDLVRVDVGDLSSDFPEEVPTLQGYFAPSALTTTERLFQQLQRAAEATAARVVADAEAYARLVGCVTQDAGCRDSFIEEFGLRAYRRPLNEAETAAYTTLFDASAEWSPAGEAFAGGVQSVVEAMLQSPNFLYRIERGSDTRDDAGVELTAWEIASRLSFMLNGTIPDDALLAAARSGELSTPEGIATQARRLVDGSEVEGRIVDFHTRWAQFGDLEGISKSAEAFPQFSSALVSSVRASTERFIADVTLSENGGLQSLLTAPYAYVDQNLASLYGLTGSFGPELQRVELDPAGPRAGLLTQAGFLMGHSSSDNGTSPILRGVFVLRRLLCQPIPDPPPNAQSTVPPPPEVPIVTTRDYFEWKTGMAACQGCHSMINPMGFAFEEFDGIGSYRTSEKGAPVDASGTLDLSTDSLEFVGGRELATALAAQPEAQACYARNWLRYLWGRADTREDLRTLTVLRQGLANPDYGVRDLLIDVTQSAAFTHINELE